jgi:hypothetical protein
MVAVYPFDIRNLPKGLIKNDHFMRGETVLSDQSQEKIGVFTACLSLVDNGDKAVVTKLCRNKVLVVCYGVWDVGDYVSCLDVEDSTIFIHHE